MINFSVVLALGTLIAFALSILLLTRICKCAYDRNSNQNENSNSTRVFIIEENGDVIVVQNDEDDIEKNNVKHSYENLAPPPYLRILTILGESSYEPPPPYPIDIDT